MTTVVIIGGYLDMAFNIKIGYTTDNSFKVGKSATWINNTGTTQAVMYPLEGCTVLYPIFRIDYNALYLTANYVYCNETGYYYTCTVEVDTAQTMILRCSIDYLSSFDLSDCPITVTRSEIAGINSIPDNQLPVLPNEVDTQYITVYNEGLSEGGIMSRMYVINLISGGVNYGS